jgi:hypothetical protein
LSSFAFQISAEEWEATRSQNVTASKRNVRFLPWVVTEHGALKAANVLQSERAIAMSVELINAFIRLHHGLPAFDVAHGVRGARKTI